MSLWPGCQIPIFRERNPFRPFGSERCQRVDLVSWLVAEYRIPAESASMPAEEASPMEEQEVG